MSADPKNPLGALDPSACWDLLERVAATPSLKRAARLREFLLFVGTKSLKEGRTEIHEQEIGESVFGRPRDYETSQDNIVRVSATELRKRVDAYFAAKGSAEPIVFGIPRGSYLPAFRLREGAIRPDLTLPAGQASADVETAPPRSPAVSRERRLLWIVSAIAALLAIACILLWRQNSLLHYRIHLLENEHAVFAAPPTSGGFQPSA